MSYFINYFDNGIFFVTSREQLDWFDSDTDKRVIENHSLECIPKSEVQKYLLKRTSNSLQYLE